MTYLDYDHDENYNYNLNGKGTVINNIAYSDISEKNKLDLYLPTKKSETYPLVIYIHGGGFVKGDKTHHLSGILHVLERGYAVAAINYRTGEDAPYPALLEDCCDAIRFLKKNSESYKLNPDQFVLWGDTHGGYLASRIAIEGPKGILDELESEYPEVDLNVRGVISFYGPMDLYDFHIFKNFEFDLKTFQMEEPELLEFLRGLNPIKNIDGSECPFYLLHGKLDFFIPHKYTQQFADTLTEYGVDHVLDFVEDGIHAIDFYVAEKYNEPIMQFIDRVIK